LTRHLIGVAGLVAILAVAAPSAGSGDDATGSSALQAELDALLSEIQDSVEHGPDPFSDGTEPDLLVLSSANVQGEIAPCG